MTDIVSIQFAGGVLTFFGFLGLFKPEIVWRLGFLDPANDTDAQRATYSYRYEILGLIGGLLGLVAWLIFN